MTPASPPANAPPSPSKTSESPEPAPVPSPEFVLGAGGILGTGWDDGDAQRGFWASASAGLPKTPLFAVVGARYAWSEGPTFAAGTLDSHWYDVSLGIGLATVVRPARLRLFGAPEVAIQFVSATVSGSDARLADHEARLRVRGGIAWPADGHVGAVLGGTVRLLPFAGDEVPTNHARTSRIAADLFAGIELRL